jgi:hypothetical protein
MDKEDKQQDEKDSRMICLYESRKHQGIGLKRTIAGTTTAPSANMVPVLVATKKRYHHHHAWKQDDDHDDEDALSASESPTHPIPLQKPRAAEAQRMAEGNRNNHLERTGSGTTSSFSTTPFNNDDSSSKPLLVVASSEQHAGKGQQGLQAAMPTTPPPGCAFPFHLHHMLNDAERSGFQHIVSWLKDARSFKVHNKEEFEKSILFRYFRGQTHYKSFQRQRKHHHPVLNKKGSMMQPLF